MLWLQILDMGSASFGVAIPALMAVATSTTRVDDKDRAAGDGRASTIATRAASHRGSIDLRAHPVSMTGGARHALPTPRSGAGGARRGPVEVGAMSYPYSRGPVTFR